jgi:hypothetical protein
MKYSISYMETYFLSDLEVRIEDLQPLAHNCTKVIMISTCRRTFGNSCRQNKPLFLHVKYVQNLVIVVYSTHRRL